MLAIQHSTSERSDMAEDLQHPFGVGLLGKLSAGSQRSTIFVLMSAFSFLVHMKD